jgi:putative sterol carrier protein
MKENMKNHNITLNGPEEVFYKMLTRELDSTRAYFAKQYTIEGSISNAMKPGSIGTTIQKQINNILSSFSFKKT